MTFQGHAIILRWIPDNNTRLTQSYYRPATESDNVICGLLNRTVSNDSTCSLEGGAMTPVAPPPKYVPDVLTGEKGLFGGKISFYRIFFLLN